MPVPGQACGVDANRASRVFHVIGGASVGISGLSITNGASGLYGGGIYNDHSTLSVINCTLSGNSADAAAGAFTTTPPTAPRRCGSSTAR